MNSNPSSAHQDATRPIDLPRLDALASNDPPLLPQRLAAFAGVRATVTVVAGAASASIGELLALKDGAVLPLDRAVEAPFDVVLDGAVLARGHLVAVGDHFGLRITEVCARGQD
ncbi:MAG: FliM/FliN family flagellar motor switch protein [Burkholderiales bacterium]|jgi:flagellar motor switch protein FliN/FliY|nr:FliM/FliN family flagellar motor switch protein [Burkholderiales bacterium]